MKTIQQSTAGSLSMRRQVPRIADWNVTQDVTSCPPALKHLPFSTHPLLSSLFNRLQNIRQRVLVTSSASRSKRVIIDSRSDSSRVVDTILLPDKRDRARPPTQRCHCSRWRPGTSTRSIIDEGTSSASRDSIAILGPYHSCASSHPSVKHATDDMPGIAPHGT
jgi:hypothetical protein